MSHFTFTVTNFKKKSIQMKVPNMGNHTEKTKLKKLVISVFTANCGLTVKSGKNNLFLQNSQQ